MTSSRSFCSDNNSGACPAALDALAQANDGHVHAYGDDEWTRGGADAVRALVGGDPAVFFAFNGTGANVTAISGFLRAGDAVVCASSAHITVDECGAVERLSGCKVIEVPTNDGKLRPDDIEPLLHVLGVEHHAQPRVVSISQVAETGVVYAPDEVRALAGIAHAHGLYLHMDGARIANAAVSLGVAMSEFTSDAGVDALSFGGTKNGLVFGEAVCLFAPETVARYPFQRKSGTQLASKMRYVGAQFSAVYGGGLWRELAGHANAMAARLAQGAEAAGVTLVWPVAANEVFAAIPTEKIDAMRAVTDFYDWEKRPDGTTVVRWVCSWDTTEEDVDRFVEALPRIVGAST